MGQLFSRPLCAGHVRWTYRHVPVVCLCGREALSTFGARAAARFDYATFWNESKKSMTGFAVDARTDISCDCRHSIKIKPAGNGKRRWQQRAPELRPEPVSNLNVWLDQRNSIKRGGAERRSTRPWGPRALHFERSFAVLCPRAKQTLRQRSWMIDPRRL